MTCISQAFRSVGFVASVFGDSILRRCLASIRCPTSQLRFRMIPT